MHVPVSHTRECRPQQMSGIILKLSSTLLNEAKSNSKLAKKASLASQFILGIPPLPSKARNTSRWSCPPDIYMGSRNPNSSFMISCLNSKCLTPEQLPTLNICACVYTHVYMYINTHTNIYLNIDSELVGQVVGHSLATLDIQEDDSYC